MRKIFRIEHEDGSGPWKYLHRHAGCLDGVPAEYLFGTYSWSGLVYWHDMLHANISRPLNDLVVRVYKCPASAVVKQPRVKGYSPYAIKMGRNEPWGDLMTRELVFRPRKASVVATIPYVKAMDIAHALTKG